MVRVARNVAGFSLLAVGVVMLPGPGWLTIVGGLALLAREHSWARRLLDASHEAAARCGRISEGNAGMLHKARSRIVRAITDAMWACDRLQMRAIDAVIGHIRSACRTPPRRRSGEEAS